MRIRVRMRRRRRKEREEERKVNVLPPLKQIFSTIEKNAEPYCWNDDASETRMKRWLEENISVRQAE